MSSNTETLAELLARQSLERDRFKDGVFRAWQPIGEYERKLLEPYEGRYKSAPDNIKAEIDQNREEFYKEYGTEGHLVVLMDKRHGEEREMAMKRQQTLDRLKEEVSRNKEKGRGR